MVRRQMLYGLVALLICVSAQAEDRIRVANEGGIRDDWTLPPGAKLAVPAYPSRYADSKADVCVAIGYLLNPDGTTSDFSLLKGWAEQEPRQEREAYWKTFAGGASAALSTWKFVPRSDSVTPRAVYTVATFVFGSAASLELRKRCVIPNLAQHLLELRHDNRLKRRMAEKGLFDRLDIDPLLEQRYQDLYRRNDEAIRPIEPPPTPSPPPSPPPNPPAGGG